MKTPSTYKSLGVVLLTLAVCGSAHADPDAFLGLHWNGASEEVRLVNPLNGQATLLNTIPGMVSLIAEADAVDLVNHRLYQIGFNGAAERRLHVIDTQNGALVNNVLVGAFSNLQVRSDGTLLGLTWNGTAEELHSINTTTGASTLLSTIPGLDFVYPAASALDLATDRLYQMGLSGGTTTLFTINALTGGLISSVTADRAYANLQVRADGSLVGLHWNGGEEQLRLIFNPTASGLSFAIGELNGLTSLAAAANALGTGQLLQAGFAGLEEGITNPRLFVADDPNGFSVAWTNYSSNALLANLRFVGVTVSINDVTLVEGDAGTTNFDFTISLSNPTNQEVTVGYSTSDGTATTANNDYQPVSGTATIPALSTSTTATVVVNTDLIEETNETFSVNLFGAVNATIADGVGQGSIENDDSGTTVSISDASASEGTDLTFTVSLSNPTSQNVTVAYATSDGSATVANNDYQAASAMATIPAKMLSTTVTVTINDDAINEGDETLTVTLSSPVNATLGDAVGEGTIQNDDSTPAVSIDDVSQAEGNSGTSNFDFTLSLSNPTDKEVTVSFTTVGGTATTDNDDYEPVSATATIPAKESQTTVAVVVNGDTTLEGNETFFVSLLGATNATIADGTGQGTIQDDDGAPTIAIDDVAKPEGAAGTTALTFTISLSNPTDQEVTVGYSTADGTATLANDDYVSVSATATIPAKSASTTVTVDVNGDLTLEADETLVVNLSNPVNATLGDGQGVGTILNDDGLPTVSIKDVSEVEGDADKTPFEFVVLLSNPSDVAVTVDYFTTTGTATTDNNDYQHVSATATIPAKASFTTVTVLVNGDIINEADETFSVTLASPIGATLGTATATGTIENDDATPTISIDDVMAAEGNLGKTPFTFTVSLSNPVSSEVTVDFITKDGTATLANSDYQATAGTATIAAKTTSTTITVMVTGDTNLEPGSGPPDFFENFFVSLSSPSVNATIADDTGEGRIVDDEATPALLQRFEPFAGDAGIELRWQFSEAGLFASVAVERAEAEEGPWTSVAMEQRVEDGVTVALDRTVASLTSYYYRLVASTEGDEQIVFGPITITSVEIFEFALSSIGPNPMRDVVRVTFSVARTARVKVAVYDIQGREVAVVTEGIYRAGRHEAAWSGRSTRGTAHAGVYFVRYQTPEKSFVKRLSLIR